MKTRNNYEEQKRWLELLEKHKGQLSINDLKKVRNAIKRNKDTWDIWLLKLNMIILEYPLEGESSEGQRTDNNI